VIEVIEVFRLSQCFAANIVPFLGNNTMLLWTSLLIFQSTWLFSCLKQSDYTSPSPIITYSWPVCQLVHCGLEPLVELMTIFYSVVRPLWF